MIPRPETEQLVELLISNFKSQISNGRIVDVGTGSGAIALSLAAEFPEAEVFAADVSDDALSLARENAERLGLADRVQFLKGNLLEKVEDAFDLIAANLPYISSQERHTLSREVLRDPEVAVFAGTRGDEFVRELIAQAPSRLRPGGLLALDLLHPSLEWLAQPPGRLLALEIGIGQSNPLFSALAEKNYRDISTKNDYSGVTRFLFARYG
jgi:release factor glutamine methyltransferase